MGLSKSIGNTIIVNFRNEVANSLCEVEIDYYFMASRFARSKTIINLILWTVLIDNEGFVYCMKTNHIGEFDSWQDVIRERIKEHLFNIGIDNLIVKRMVRDIEIKKDGHLIKNDSRCGGNKIGINGSNEIHIRASKFTFLK